MEVAHQEEVLALAYMVVEGALARVTLFQVHLEHSVEVAALLDFQAWKVRLTLLLAVFQPLRMA